MLQSSLAYRFLVVVAVKVINYPKAHTMIRTYPLHVRSVLSLYRPVTTHGNQHRTTTRKSVHHIDVSARHRLDLLLLRSYVIYTHEGQKVCVKVDQK
jgi:hypothetical protein